MSTHCCMRMDSALEHDCDTHKWPWDCPDSLVAHNVSGGDYGLRIHDGGASFVVIEFCPWCGTRLGGDAS